MWKIIKDYENYAIHYEGKVKRLISKNSPKERFLKNIKSSNGYLHIGLCKNGKVRNFSIHRLVAEAFIKNPENKPHVNHLDGNRKNNHVENLEWVTCSENMLHAIHVTKTKPAPYSMLGKFGNKHNRSKHFYVDHGDGFILYESGLEFTRKTGFDHSAVSYARARKYKYHTFTKGKMKGLTVKFD